MATINGTSGNDTLTGTSGADVIYSKGGNDVVDGAGGNDEIGGGSGNDALDGGGGNDTIYGGGGADTVEGGAGNDIVFGGAGDDEFIGGSGDDTIVGGTGDDFLRGGSGTDVFQFYNNHGNDIIGVGEIEPSDGDVIQLGGSITSYTLSPSGLVPGSDGLYGTSDDEYLFISIDTGEGNIVLSHLGYLVSNYSLVASSLDSAIELI